MNTRKKFLFWSVILSAPLIFGSVAAFAENKDSPFRKNSNILLRMDGVKAGSPATYFYVEEDFGRDTEYASFTTVPLKSDPFVVGIYKYDGKGNFQKLPFKKSDRAQIQQLPHNGALIWKTEADGAGPKELAEKMHQHLQERATVYVHFNDKDRAKLFDNFLDRAKGVYELSFKENKAKIRLTEQSILAGKLVGRDRKMGEAKFWKQDVSVREGDVMITNRASGATQDLKSFVSYLEREQETRNALQSLWDSLNKKEIERSEHVLSPLDASVMGKGRDEKRGPAHESGHESGKSAFGGDAR